MSPLTYHWKIYAFLSCLMCLASSITHYDLSSYCHFGYNRTIFLQSPILYPWNSTVMLSTGHSFGEANCTIDILSTTPILLSVRRIDIRPLCLDILKVVHTGGTLTYCNSINDPKESETLISYGPMIIIYEATKSSNHASRGFEVVITAIDIGAKCDNALMHKCNNGRCIADVLKCENHNHCGDGSRPARCDISGGMIAGYCIGGIILFLGIVFIIIRCKRYVERNNERTTTSNRLMQRYANFRPKRAGENHEMLGKQSQPGTALYIGPSPAYTENDHDTNFNK